jgi:hypothetical protein
VLAVIVGESGWLVRSDRYQGIDGRYLGIALSSAPCLLTYCKEISRVTFEDVLVAENDFFEGRYRDVKATYDARNLVFGVYRVLDSANVRVCRMLQSLGDV